METGLGGVGRHSDQQVPTKVHFQLAAEGTVVELGRDANDFPGRRSVSLRVSEKQVAQPWSLPCF